MRKKYELEEKPICNAVSVFRERGNYLQRLEQFEKAILAYNEALRWNPSDVLSLFGRSLARAKSTHYAGALEDAARAAELEPENPTALQIKAQTEYEKCAFERALTLAHRGLLIRRYPPDFADCARVAEETVRDCIVGIPSNKILETAALLFRETDNKIEQEVGPTNIHLKHKCRMQTQPTHQVQEISRAEQQRHKQIYRLMSSKYLERMAHDKYFLTALCKDERLTSANKQGSKKLLELANKALADIENRQIVLRERCPLYAARASETAAKARLLKTRKEQIQRAQLQHIADAERLIGATRAAYENKNTAKCLEAAEFAMERISRKLHSSLPGKEKFLQELYDTVAEAFLDQKRVKEAMSESNREKRAFILLGMALSREPSRDSVLRVRPASPPRNAIRRLRTLERYLAFSTRTSERCYLLHELARLHVEIKQALRARYYALKCQSEARASNHRAWLLNASFLLARCNLLQNNRPEARAVLLEGAGLARTFGYNDVSAFFDTCVEVSLEGEVLNDEAALEKRERDMVDLMQDDDLKSAAEHLFRRMSVLPANRRFSILPGTKVEETGPISKRRASIMPNISKPTRISYKNQQPLGLQDFDRL